MLRLDTRLGPNTGDYDAVTPTQARLASDLSLFDTFMPAAPPLRQSPPPVQVASPVSEEALVFIHPPTATAPQHQNPAATSTPRQASLAQFNANGDGRPIRQNSYPTPASTAAVNSVATSGVEASSSQYGARARSASTGVSLSNADLSFFPNAFYNYTAAAQNQSVASGSPNLQPNVGFVSLPISPLLPIIASLTRVIFSSTTYTARNRTPLLAIRLARRSRVPTMPVRPCRIMPARSLLPACPTT